MNPIAIVAVSAMALGGVAGGLFWVAHDEAPCHAYRFGDEPAPGQAYASDSPCRSYNITCREDYTTEPAGPDSETARLRLVIENDWRPMAVVACIKNDLSVPLAVASEFVQVGQSLVLETRVVPGATIVSTGLEEGRAMQGTVYDVPRCAGGAYEIRLGIVGDGESFRTNEVREACTFTLAAQGPGSTASPSSDGRAAGWLVGGLSLAVGAGMAAWRWSSLRWFLGGLFSRFAGPEVLEQETRARIHDAIRTDPGIHAEELARRLGLASSQVRYHLGVLGRERLVTRLRAAGHVHVFPVGRFRPEEMRRRVAQRYPQWARLLKAVEAEPGATLGSLARRTGLSEPSASKVARRLAAFGLVRRRRVGRVVLHEPL